MSKDKVEQHKKWTQKYVEASEEINRLSSSPDHFFSMSREDIKKWKQAVNRLEESVSELNRLLDDEGEEKYNIRVDVRDIGL